MFEFVGIKETPNAAVLVAATPLSDRSFREPSAAVERFTMAELEVPETAKFPPLWSQ
jgi:hypothetical protein